MSSVSCAMRRCFASGSEAIVRMLWSRSASLISRTRMSLAIATSILRRVAACCASLESNWRRSSLVTPSTIRRDLGAEPVLEVLERQRGVLDRVVQERARRSSRRRARARRGSSRRPAGARCRARPERRTCSAWASRATVVGLLDQRGVGPAVTLLVRARAAARARRRRGGGATAAGGRSAGPGAGARSRSHLPRPP